MKNILNDNTQLVKQIEEEFKKDCLDSFILMPLMIKLNNLKTKYLDNYDEKIEKQLCMLIKNKKILINYLYNIDDLHFHTPLSYAIHCGFINIIMALLKRKDLNINMPSHSYTKDFINQENRNSHPLLFATPQLIETGIVIKILEHKYLRLSTNNDVYNHITGIVIDNINNCEYYHRKTRIKTLKCLLKYAIYRNDIEDLSNLIWDFENIDNKEEIINSGAKLVKKLKK